LLQQRSKHLCKMVITLKRHIHRKRRPQGSNRCETKVSMVRGSFLIAAAALKTPTRNGYNAQGVSLARAAPKSAQKQKDNTRKHRLTRFPRYATVTLRGVSCGACCDHGRSYFSVVARPLKRRRHRKTTHVSIG